MEGNPWKGEPIVDLEISRIGLHYERFRLVRPSAYDALKRSMERHGQISPIVVGRPEHKQRFELIDGFKRLRAAERLGLSCLKARILDVCVHALKVAIVELNTKLGSICEMEEAMVVRSLHRDDGLQQTEIALLFGRHKSWVCRRIAIIERLDEGVQDHIRLGLISIGIARELAKLPRGNQKTALEAVLKHRLICREVERLVGELLSRPRWEHANILWAPWEVLDERGSPSAKHEGPAADAQLEQAFFSILQGVKSVVLLLETLEAKHFSAEQRCMLLEKLDQAEEPLSRIRALLNESIHETEVRENP